MDPELKEYLDNFKATMEERFAQQDARTDERFERVETTVRHTQVLLEALNSKVDLVYEGVDGANQKLTAFQEETAKSFEEVQASFPPYFRHVNGKLDSEIPALDRRVTALEARPSRRAGKKPQTQ